MSASSLEVGQKIIQRRLDCDGSQDSYFGRTNRGSGQNKYKRERYAPNPVCHIRPPCSLSDCSHILSRATNLGYRHAKTGCSRSATRVSLPASTSRNW